MGFLLRFRAKHAVGVMRAVAILVCSIAAACRSLESVASGCVITELSVSPDTSNVAAGGSLILQATLRETGCDNVQLFWSSSNASVASVSQNGVVKGLKAGASATIAASVLGRSATSTVRVVGPRLPILSP